MSVVMMPRPEVAETPAPVTAPVDQTGRIEIEDLNLYYGAFRAVRDISMTIEPRSVTAIIGPSGCGKSTFIRSLNRMHEVTPGARVEGSVRLDGIDVYDADVDPAQLRRVVGMAFQGPPPCPPRPLFHNVCAR